MFIKAVRVSNYIRVYVVVIRDCVHFSTVIEFVGNVSGWKPL